MNLEFLTPPGGLLALLVLLPVAAFLGISRRADRLRLSLGLPEPSRGRRLVPLVAVVVVAGLLGAAAAQPVLERTTTRQVRSDAEVLIVIDITRSMLAQRGLEDPTRLARAKIAAAELRASLPDVPVGLASVTNRVLPHLFPSADEVVFRATLDRVIDIERPPPGSSFLTAIQRALRNATSLGSLVAVPTRHFYSPTARHRLLVVLTDGESARFSPASVARRLRVAKIDIIFVQFWAKNERVFTDGEPEERYEPDPEARAILDGLAAASRGSVYGETRVGAAARRARDVLGTGPTVSEGDRPDRMALAPYLTVAAFLPLGFLLWRRDR